MKKSFSPMGTNPEQSNILINAGIPEATADMYLVKHWAYSFGELCIMDKNFSHPREEGVDHIPAWSLSHLIDFLPECVNIAENDDCLLCVQYNLHIDKNYVKYISYENSEPIYETFGLNIIDAVVDMIVKLIDNGWSEEIIGSGCPS